MGAGGGIFTRVSVGSVGGSNKTAETPGDVYTKVMSVYLGPCIVPPMPWTRVP